MKWDNTDAIFSTIGNYPIVDQFDVLYSNLQTGTTYDNYITGALLKSISVSGSTGERGLAFNKLAVSQTALPDTGALTSTDDPFQSYKLQPWRERAGLIRNLRIFSNSERFYDSLAPNLNDMVTLTGGRLYRSPFSGIVFTFGNDVTIGSFTSYSSIGFVESFPFEPLYSTVNRQERVSKRFTTDVDSSGNSLTRIFVTTNLIVRDLTRFLDATINSFTDGGFWTKYVSSTSNRPIEGPAEEDLSKILFGFGDGRTQTPTPFDTYSQPPRKYLPMYRKLGEGSSYKILVSPIIRGWKYGLIDGNPHYTSCVFRRDRYGQFRDMLEQRLISTSYTDTRNSPTKYFGSFEEPSMPSTVDSENSIKEGTITRPLEVKFLRQAVVDNKQQYFTESPVNTWSSNLSLYATSSLPFFDGVNRNRSEITTPPNSYFVTNYLDITGNSTVNIG